MLIAPLKLHSTSSCQWEARWGHTPQVWIYAAEGGVLDLLASHHSAGQGGGLPQGSRQRVQGEPAVAARSASLRRGGPVPVAACSVLSLEPGAVTQATWWG